MARAWRWTIISHLMMALRGKKGKMYCFIGAGQIYLWGLLVLRIEYIWLQRILEKLKARSMSKPVCLNSRIHFVVEVCCTTVIARFRMSIVVAIHTFIPSFSPKHVFIRRIVGHLASLLCLSISTNMQDVLLHKTVQQIVANASVRSIAMVISLAHLCIIDVHVSQSFPLSMLGPDSHLS